MAHLHASQFRNLTDRRFIPNSSRCSLSGRSPSDQLQAASFRYARTRTRTLANMSTPGVQVHRHSLLTSPGHSSGRSSAAHPHCVLLQEYIDTHSLQKVVEDVLNGCVKTKPDDPLSFMVRGLLATLLLMI